jgi:hypothetical protein
MLRKYEMSKATGNMAMAELMMLHRRLNGKSIIASEYQAGLLKKKEEKRLKKFGKGFKSTYKLECLIR